MGSACEAKTLRDISVSSLIYQRRRTSVKMLSSLDKTVEKLVRQVVLCSGFISAFGGLLPLSVQGYFVYCWQRVKVPLAAIGSLVLLYIAAFTHGRRIIAHFVPMARRIFMKRKNIVCTPSWCVTEGIEKSFASCI